VLLEEQVKKASTPLSPSAVLQRASSAAEIDNENLREQVQYLQRKLATLEDSLEDTRAVSEREESTMRERIRRFKEKEDAMRNELNDGRKTVEQVLKAEALAKSRIEEVEEALRESTLALKNAQAEIENLRSDAVVSGLLGAASHNIADQVAGVETSSVSDSPKLGAGERVRLTEEIHELRTQLNQVRPSVAEVISASTISDVRVRPSRLHTIINGLECRMPSSGRPNMNNCTKKFSTCVRLWRSVLRNSTLRRRDITGTSRLMVLKSHRRHQPRLSRNLLNSSASSWFHSSGYFFSAHLSR